MARRMWIAIWPAAGFLLGAAVFAGGQGDEGLREKLSELEALSAKLRSLEGDRPELPAATDKGLEISCVPLADLLCGTPDWVGPRRAGRVVPIFGGSTEPQPAYGTIEEIVELVRTRVHPEAWESGSNILYVGRSLLVLARPDVSRDVHAFVDRELRPSVRRTVILEVEIVEAADALAGTLAAAAGGDLDPATRTGVDEAIAAGKARRIFAGRARALYGQQVVLWHGAQVAMVADADVEVHMRSETSDPVVITEIDGTVVQARSILCGDPARIRIQLALEHDALDRPARTIKTGGAGTIQMPSRSTLEVTTDLLAGSGHWAVAGERKGTGATRQFVLARATPVAGGAR